MTRDQQIRKALEVLAPPSQQRDECRHDVERMLDWIERLTDTARSFRMTSSKEGKASLKRYCAALRRLRYAYSALDPAIKPWFSLAEVAYVAGTPTVIDREIEKAEGILAQPSPPPRRDASRNKFAVAMSKNLLDWWGHKAVVTRSGKWAQLAQIMTGDPTVDLFDHLREFKLHPSLSIEKVRSAHGIIYRLRRQ